MTLNKQRKQQNAREGGRKKKQKKNLRIDFQVPAHVWPPVKKVKKFKSDAWQYFCVCVVKKISFDIENDTAKYRAVKINPHAHRESSQNCWALIVLTFHLAILVLAFGREREKKKNNKKKRHTWSTLVNYSQ